MIITERDKTIIKTVSMFRLALGRQIMPLCGFSGQRACDRRLCVLIDNGYLLRERMIYGVAGIYTVTVKAKKEFDIHLSIGKPRLDQIRHDISVVDTVIYLMKTENITLSDIKTEKELRHEHGFTNKRGHEPDFIYTKNDEKICVEVELSLKAKDRLLKNIEYNFRNYDTQKWIVPKDKTKIREILTSANNKYSNIKIVDFEKITDFVNEKTSIS
jgi:hypothetical protein